MIFWKKQRWGERATGWAADKCKGEVSLCSYSDFDVLLLQFFNVLGLLLEHLPLLVFNRLGNQDVVIGQWCVLSDKNNPLGFEQNQSNLQVSHQILTTGGNDVCSFPFSLTTPMNSRSSILGCNDKMSRWHHPPYSLYQPDAGSEALHIWLHQYSRGFMRILFNGDTRRCVSEYQCTEKPGWSGEDTGTPDSDLGWRYCVTIQREQVQQVNV